MASRFSKIREFLIKPIEKFSANLKKGLEKVISKNKPLKNKMPKSKLTDIDYVDYDTGEIIDKDAIKEAYKEGKKLAQVKQEFNYQDNIDYYFNSIERWNDKFQNEMRSWITGLINKTSVKDVSIMISKGIANGVIITKEIVYEEDKRSAYIAEMMEYLDIEPDLRAELLEEAEKNIGWGDQM